MALLTEVGSLLADNLPSFETIGLAWTSKPIADFDAEVPAALYYLSRIQSEASPYDANETVQPGDYEITVLMVCDISALETLLAEVNSAMVGFQPTGSFEAFEHVSGDALDVNQSLIWWRSVYAARNYNE